MTKNINKVKDSYTKAVRPIILEIYKKLEMYKYEDIWENRFRIYKEAKITTKDAELMQVVHNFTDLINYFNTTFSYKEILVLDKDELDELFPGTIEETREILEIFKTEKVMPELKVGQLQKQAQTLNNLKNKSGMVYSLYKVIIYFTFYNERIAASAYTEFLYRQYLISKGKYTNEFSGGGNDDERVFG